MACVDVRALPLQLLLRREPSFRSVPAAVVDRDRPQGIVRWLNELAFGKGVRPGMRYATGLSLASDLRAGVVDDATVQAGTREIVALLQRHSPGVEPSPRHLGTFWVDATGLSPLYPSLPEWAGAVHAALGAAALQARVVVGFTRFGTYAVTRGRPASAPEVLVLASPGEERDACRAVPLERLGIDPDLRDTLRKLGIRTVGSFLDLPEGGVRERFGVEAHRLHRFASRTEWTPLQGAAADVPLSGRIVLDDPEKTSTGLVFLVKRLLHPLLETLASRQEGVTELRLCLGLDRGGTVEEALRPASPTLDVAQLMGLVALRLEGLVLPSGAIEIALGAASARVTAEQLRLFARQARRDPRAAERAFARLRAELGNDAVVHARAREGHLPEASFTWEPLDRAVAPHPRPAAAGEPERPMVRRLFDRPRKLPPRSRNEPDGWLLQGVEHGSVERFVGPYVVSGGWWATPVHREYHFALMRKGDVYWIYYDRKRRRWFLQGQVE